MIINRKSLARKKLENLKQGYSAYAETEEVARLIEKELANLNIPVYIDRTPIGWWFIPEKSNKPLFIDPAASRLNGFAPHPCGAGVSHT